MRIEIDPAAVAANFERVKDNPSLAESAQLFARGLPVVEMIRAMSMSGSVLRAFAAFESIYPHGNLERGVLEKVILCVSRLHQCQFCTASHTEIMQHLQLQTDLASPVGHSERERLAVEYAEAMTADSNRVADSLFDRLKQRFTAAEIVELTFLVGFITMLNRFNNALGVRYHREFADVAVS